MRIPLTRSSVSSSVFIVIAAGALISADNSTGGKSGTSPIVFSGYREQKPGVFHRITPSDLPKPYASESVDNGPDRLIPRPADAWPKTVPGFEVKLYANGLQNPRLIRKAPNGDLFVAESEPQRGAPGNIKVFRGIGKDGKAQTVSTFATGLAQPFGIAFYPPGANPTYVYIANTDSVIRYPYRNGDLKARGNSEVIVPDIPGGGRLRGGGHWTRDIVFSPDGKKMFVSVGSHSNVDDPDTHKAEYHRANILEFNPDGSGIRVYAYGIRNPVGLAIDTTTGELWTSVNERDRLGDNLVPDYITHVREGGFYGWPWYYIGGNQDPRHAGKHPELKSKVIVPDVLLQPHNASLQLTFYDAKQFPAEYHGNIFAAEHGSWNRAERTGYEVIRVPIKAGRATGEYEDFLTGFVTSDGQVWGRPVGVAVAEDGSLMVTDDGSNSIWRISYVGK
jgi:glucose/arabinose dehydrogenase